MDSLANILPSAFNRRITVKQAVNSVNASGGVSVGSYTVLFTTWASVNNMKTGAKIQFGLDAFTSAFKIVFYYATGRDLTTGMLIDYLDGGTTISLRIMSVNMIAENYKKYLVVMAQEVEASS